MGIVEGRTAAWGWLIGARQAVDTAAVLEGFVGPDRFGDDNAPAQFGEGLRVEDNSAALIAQPDLLAIRKAQSREIVRVNEQLGASFPLP
jgi:hypothetical protein